MAILAVTLAKSSQWAILIFSDVNISKLIINLRKFVKCMISDGGSDEAVKR